MTDLSIYLINSDATIKEALKKIEDNHSGFVFIEKNQRVEGVVTDGDIRRYLLLDNNLDIPVMTIAVRDFKYCSPNTSPETIIKIIDEETKFVPLLSSTKKLLKIYSRDNFPPIEKQIKYVKSRAPVRISFGGGGSDLTHYFKINPGAVLNATINKYSNCTLVKRSDKLIKIKSWDLDLEYEGNLKDFLNHKEKRWSLIKSIITKISPDFGFELEIFSDFPIGSGLGGSSTVGVAIIGCFNEHRVAKWSKYEIAEIAYQAERQLLGVSGGWQDQYASVFGGINFMEFNYEANIVQKLDLESNTYAELERQLILCKLKGSHNSGDIHDHQKKQMEKKNVVAAVKKSVKLCYKLKNLLYLNKLDSLGNALHDAWTIKRSFSSKISNRYIDKIYSGALKNGALGGKLMGAGGTGFLLFFAETNMEIKLKKYLNQNDLQVENVRFSFQGLETWATAEKVLES